MSDDRWIVVPNWDKFQHYHDRDPTWIKLYVDLETRDEWRQLSLSARGLLVSIWIRFALQDGQMRKSDVPVRTREDTFDSLLRAGFIRVRSSKPLALARARAKSRDRTPTPKRGGRAKAPEATGWRLVRGSHGQTLIPDPLGTDKPPSR